MIKDDIMIGKKFSEFFFFSWNWFFIFYFLFFISHNSFEPEKYNPVTNKYKIHFFDS